MVKTIIVEGYEAVMKAIADNSNKDIFVLFSGSKDSSGESWCPDCVSAKPIIEKGLQSAPSDAVFIYCSVGDRAYWKNPSIEFRQDERLKLTIIPTLIKWSTTKKLDGEQCKNEALVSMLFEE